MYGIEHENLYSFVLVRVMNTKIKIVDKAFILAGGKGKRIQLGKKQNLKAFKCSLKVGGSVKNGQNIFYTKFPVSDYFQSFNIGQ